MRINIDNFNILKLRNINNFYHISYKYPLTIDLDKTNVPSCDYDLNFRQK